MADLSKAEMRRQLQDAVINTGGSIVASAPKKTDDRTSRGLRDVLFDELFELRSGDGDPRKAMAVAQVARQIMNTVRVEMEYYRIAAKEPNQALPELGDLKLGSVVDANAIATER